MVEDDLKLFSSEGGKFLLPLEDFVNKALKIKAIIFDWDGVFNSGVKGENVYSGFSEPDSMGLNILRFAYFLKDNRVLTAGIISGEKNPSAEKFISREHLDFKCLAFKNKIEGFYKVLEDFSLKPEETAFVFDDILDLSVAEKCGLRFLVSRKSSPMFSKFVTNNKSADYITFSSCNDFAVREITELLCAAIGFYEKAAQSRIKYDENYADYISKRNSITAITYSPKTTY